MIRFECKKCGNLVVTESGVKSATCTVCGKTQRIPAVVIDDSQIITRHNYDPQWDHYAQLVNKARKYRDIDVLRETADEFYRLGTYKDSLQMAEFCEKRIAEEQERRTRESDKQKIKDQRWKKGTKLYHIKMAILNTFVLALIIGITLLSNVFHKQPRYEDGLKYMNQGMYNEAISTFNRLGGYKDSREMIQAAKEAQLNDRYNNAIAAMENELYAYAAVEFKELDGYKDSDTMILECKYRQAITLMGEGKYQAALAQFSAIADYKDAADLAEAAKAKLNNP